MEQVQGIDYQFIIPENDDERIHIKIISGEYNGIIYKYGDIKLDENVDGMVYLQFKFDILESPIPEKKLANDVNFKNKLGDIACSVISAKLGEDNESTTNNSEESNLQRGV
jgi:hypothetical protein